MSLDSRKIQGSIPTLILFFTVAVLCQLSAVHAQQRPQRPTVETPDRYRGGEQQDQTLASVGDTKWFEIFNDPQLQNLVNTALRENYDLRAAAVRIDAQRGNLGLARSSQFPQIGAGLSYTAGDSQGGGRNFGQVLLSLLSFEIDIWGRLRQQTRAARAQLAASEEDRKAAMTTLVSEVAAGYFTLIQLDREREIADQTLADRRRSLEVIRLREQAGLATMLDVRQAEELVYSATQTIPDIEREIEQTENQVSGLLGANPGPIARGLRLGEQRVPPQIPAGLPSSLLERRPDIIAAERTLESRQAITKAARAAYFPQISLTAAFGFQSNSLAGLFSGAGRSWNAIPSLAQPIFNGGRIRSNVRIARAEQELALIAYQQTVQIAFREVSDALIAYRKVREIRGQQELLVTTLQDRSRLAYLRYEGGVDTLLSALDADRNLFDAQRDLARSQRDELLSIVQLYKALGGGWQ